MGRNKLDKEVWGAGVKGEKGKSTPQGKPLSIGWLALAGVFIFIIFYRKGMESDNTPPSKPTTSSSQGVTAQDKRQAQGLIKRAGYRCDSIGDVYITYSVSVFCDNNTNQYKLSQSGGRWEVEVK